MPSATQTTTHVAMHNRMIEEDLGKYNGRPVAISWKCNCGWTGEYNSTNNKLTQKYPCFVTPAKE